MISCRVQHFLWYIVIGLHVCQASQGTLLEQMSFLKNVSTMWKSMNNCNFLTSEEFNGTSFEGSMPACCNHDTSCWLSNCHWHFIFQAHLVTAISTQHHVRVICPRRIWCRLFILSPLALDNNKDRDCINRYHKWSVSILIDSCFSKSSWECKIWALISIHLLTKQHFYNQNKRTSNNNYYAFYMCLESLWYASTDMYDKTKNYHWNIPIASLLLQL